MATSPFEDKRIVLPADASSDEAAAIVAAIDRVLAARAATVEDAEGTIDAWRLAARLEAVTGGPARHPIGCPRDPWRAATRLTDR